MAQFSVRLENRAGCLDSLVESLERAHVQSFACSCVGETATAQFSVAESSEAARAVSSIAAQEVEAPVINLRVANRAGCLSEALLPLARAGVRFHSVACACAEGDAAGTVSVAISGV